MSIKPIINETELTLQTAEGSERAFTTLFHWYYEPLGKLVFNLIQSRELTEEIVQDAFVKIWMRRETLRSVDSFGRYMYVLCRNKTLDELKKIATQRVYHTKLEKVLIAESEVDLLDNPTDEYRQMIENAVAKLPPQQRAVYMMSRYDRLKAEEIAKKMGLSEATIKKHIQLAVKFIQASVSSSMSAGMVLVLTTPILLN
uniref:RNA polymerase sigma-70 factor n=1 Tax=Pedobacter schmidteae TaxID=2201271 RepID=UPI000EB2F37A|nr:RNA polymerase sigma-70 factor [Pedobacter schmidteae]